MVKCRLIYCNDFLEKRKIYQSYFDLPFAPFFELQITGGNVVWVQLSNNDEISTEIIYDIDSNIYNIIIHDELESQHEFDNVDNVFDGWEFNPDISGVPL